MSFALVRVDDRLIHGQVVIGWGRVVAPDLIVLANDEVAANEWERELYRMGVPEEIDVTFVSIADAARQAEAWSESSQKIVLLLGDVESLVRLCDDTTAVRAVNLGGLHHDGDRTERLPYIFLNDEEVGQLRGLVERGIEVTAQDLPGAARVSLEKLAAP